MKILLIVPGTRLMQNTKIKIPEMFTVAPNAFELLAAIAPEHNYTILNESFGDKIDFSISYDLVALSMITTQANRGYEIAKEWKKRGVPVIIGGYHVSSMPDEALNFCDSVCIGEGELVWRQILDDVQNKNLQKIYHSKKLIDLDKLPHIENCIYKKGLHNVISASRGCPHNCSFCTVHKFFGNSFRHRPIENIVNEIAILKKNKMLKYNALFIMDDNIIADKVYAKALFEALKPLKIKWVAQVTINIASYPELLLAAKESGCIWLFIGFDSISKKSLLEANKNQAMSVDYEDAIKTIHKYKISIYGAFILGFDSDNADTFRQTYEFIERNHLEYGVLNILTPFPGTKIYEEYKREGRIFDDNWDNYDMFHTVFSHNSMKPSEINYLRYHYTKKINSMFSIVKRILGARTRFFVPLIVNLKVKKLNKILPKYEQMENFNKK